jgi:hypothetical protein
LTLHALRLRGWGAPERVAARFALDVAQTTELLLDFEASGWVRRVGFADTSGWTLTEAGRVENERLLAAELADSGARSVVVETHARFLPLNARFLTACTNWQIRPMPGDPMAANDHSDHRWDGRILDELGRLGRDLRRLCAGLAGPLARFDGYGDRFTAALARVERGQRAWLDGPGIDSCHLCWMEFHEDLVATLGLRRGETA